MRKVKSSTKRRRPLRASVSEKKLSLLPAEGKTCANIIRGHEERNLKWYVL
jgi:hypothetical protein